MEKTSAVFAVLLCATLHAQAQLAVAGLEIGQEVKSCPAPSVPIGHDAGIACRFPKHALTVFGAVADSASFGTDVSGRIEGVVASGLDAVQAAAKASEEYGPADTTESRKGITWWGWHRGDARLVVFHHSGDPASSWLLLDRWPPALNKRPGLIR